MCSCMPRHVVFLWISGIFREVLHYFIWILDFDKYIVLNGVTFMLHISIKFYTYVFMILLKVSMRNELMVQLKIDYIFLAATWKCKDEIVDVFNWYWIIFSFRVYIFHLKFSFFSDMVDLRMNYVELQELSCWVRNSIAFSFYVFKVVRFLSEVVCRTVTCRNPSEKNKQSQMQTN